MVNFRNALEILTVPDIEKHCNILVRFIYKGLVVDNITIVNNKKLIERRLDTRLKINNNVALALDKIAKDCIPSLNNPTLCDINVAIYTMAITVKQYNNDLKEIPAEKTKPRQQPGWITEESFTRHQKRLQKKFRKMFHTRKIKVFEYHLTLLKQDLKATDGKRRYQYITK